MRLFPPFADTVSVHIQRQLGHRHCQDATYNKGQRIRYRGNGRGHGWDLLSTTLFTGERQLQMTPSAKDLPSVDSAGSKSPPKPQAETRASIQTKHPNTIQDLFAIWQCLMQKQLSPGVGESVLGCLPNYGSS